MKVNKFDVLSLSRIGKAFRLMAFVAVLFVFGSTDANAQYMNRSQAVETLTTQVTTLVGQLSQQTPNTAQYNYTASLAKYYKLMINDLTENSAEVKQAIVENIGGFIPSGKAIFSAQRPANQGVPLTEQQINGMQIAAENLLSI